MDWAGFFRPGPIFYPIWLGPYCFLQKPAKAKMGQVKSDQGQKGPISLATIVPKWPNFVSFLDQNGKFVITMSLTLQNTYYEIHFETNLYITYFPVHFGPVGQWASHLRPRPSLAENMCQIWAKMGQNGPLGLDGHVYFSSRIDMVLLNQLLLKIHF